MHADDANLARLAAAGDGEATGALLARLAPRIRLYGLKHLRDASRADDLVQEVLVLAVTALREGRIHDPAAIGSWTLGASRRIVWDWRKRQARREDLLGRHGELLLPPPPPGPRLDLHRLSDCVRHLPERQRAVVLLTFYADHDGPEIATELATTAGNVRVLRHRALAALAACMEGA